MKEYKSNKELIEYLESKNVRVINKKEALSIIDKYSYYSIVNSYKNIFKDSNKENCYKSDVTFEEIYSLYQFDKNLKYIFLKRREDEIYKNFTIKIKYWRYNRSCSTFQSNNWR